MCPKLLTYGRTGWEQRKRSYHMALFSSATINKPTCKSQNIFFSPEAFVYLFEIDSRYVAQAGLKLLILVLLPPDLWEYRCACHPSQLQKQAFDSRFHAFSLTPNMQRVLWTLLLHLQHKPQPSLRSPRISPMTVQIAFLHSDLLWVPFLYSAPPACQEAKSISIHF